MTKSTERDLIVGLDIGTAQVKALVGEITSYNQLSIVGVGTHVARGMDKGGVNDLNDPVRHTVGDVVCTRPRRRSDRCLVQKMIGINRPGHVIDRHIQPAIETCRWDGCLLYLLSKLASKRCEIQDCHNISLFVGDEHPAPEVLRRKVFCIYRLHGYRCVCSDIGGAGTNTSASCRRCRNRTCH